MPWQGPSYSTTHICVDHHITTMSTTMSTTMYVELLPPYRLRTASAPPPPPPPPPPPQLNLSCSSSSRGCPEHCRGPSAEAHGCSGSTCPQWATPPSGEGLPRCPSHRCLLLGCAFPGRVERKAGRGSRGVLLLLGGRAQRMPLQMRRKTGSSRGLCSRTSSTEVKREQAPARW